MKCFLGAKVCKCPTNHLLQCLVAASPAKQRIEVARQDEQQTCPPQRFSSLANLVAHLLRAFLNLTTPSRDALAFTAHLHVQLPLIALYALQKPVSRHTARIRPLSWQQLQHR